MLLLAPIDQYIPRICHKQAKKQLHYSACILKQGSADGTKAWIIENLEGISSLGIRKDVTMLSYFMILYFLWCPQNPSALFVNTSELGKEEIKNINKQVKGSG